MDQKAFNMHNFDVRTCNVVTSSAAEDVSTLTGRGGGVFSLDAQLLTGCAAHFPSGSHSHVFIRGLQL